jgi:hypothetical protein
MGPGFSSLTQEIADPENRDGAAALLDDEAHDEAVREQARKRKTPDQDSE